jgi:hypothetical protein
MEFIQRAWCGAGSELEITAIANSSVAERGFLAQATTEKTRHIIREAGQERRTEGRVTALHLGTMQGRQLHGIAAVRR